MQEKREEEIRIIKCKVEKKEFSPATINPKPKREKFWKKSE